MENYYCNYYLNGIIDQPGEQPIRVFYLQIESIFNGIKSSLTKLPQNEEFANIKFEYLTENVKVISPYTNGKSITIHESFLSFLWSLCYSNLILLPMSGKDISNEENTEARKLKQYGIDLWKGFSDWDIASLPNPENVKKSIHDYVGVANRLFINSVTFIIFHEFAHIIHKHPYVPAKYRTDLNLIAMEWEADNTALHWSINNFKLEVELLDKLCLLFATMSLSHTPNKFNPSKSHPLAEDRVTNCLNKLNLDDNDIIWGFATVLLMEWQINFDQFYLPNLEDVEKDFKSMYNKMIDELKKSK